jgi:hypothetical protein
VLRSPFGQILTSDCGTFTRAAPSTGGRAKSKFLSVGILADRQAALEVRDQRCTEFGVSGWALTNQAHSLVCKKGALGAKEPLLQAFLSARCALALGVAHYCEPFISGACKSAAG